MTGSVSAQALIVFFYSLLTWQNGARLFPTRQCPRVGVSDGRSPMKMTGSGANGGSVPHEPNLSDVLNDPVIRAVMRADGVDPDELARILRVPILSRSFASTSQSAAFGSSVGRSTQPLPAQAGSSESPAAGTPAPAPPFMRSRR